MMKCQSEPSSGYSVMDGVKIAGSRHFATSWAATLFFAARPVSNLVALKLLLFRTSALP
jgi:hypothetical protein